MNISIVGDYLIVAFIFFDMSVSKFVAIFRNYNYYNRTYTRIGFPINAVSYTHLDVYKRQPIFSAVQY